MGEPTDTSESRPQFADAAHRAHVLDRGGWLLDFCTCRLDSTGHKHHACRAMLDGQQVAGCTGTGRACGGYCPACFEARMSRHPALTFRKFAEINAARCASWHADGVPWTGADYGNEMGGECGEAQNVIKKLRRIETGVARAQEGTEAELLAQLGDELADTIICAHLVALHYGVDVEAALVRKFNATSRKHGLAELLPEAAVPSTSPHGEVRRG